jgi:hypothetical protein
MSRDLTIRLLGRPQVSSDKRTGFSKVSRRYVVQGPRATLAGINDATNPLFLEAGTADEEFLDYYLIEQTLAPANGTLDKAYLVREFLQINNSAIQEAYTQTNDLIRVRKRFAVLRNNHATLGYGTLWAKHPSQATTYAEDPWEYAPAWIRSATPGSKNYNVDNADSEHGFAETPQVGSGTLGAFAGSHASSGDWMEGYSVMTQAGSGLDVWTVEWVTHAAPYWQLGTGSGGRSRSRTVNVVDFDAQGLHLVESIASSGSVSYTTRAMTYNFFVRANSIPSDLAEISGGSASVKFSPSVGYDFTVTDKADISTHFRSLSKNSVWNNKSSLTLDGKSVGTLSGNSLILDFDATPTKEFSSIKAFNDSDLVNFKGTLVKSIKGNISWTSTKSSYSFSSSSGTFGQTKTAIAPLFSKGSEKIWKVAITYVGG